MKQYLRVEGWRQRLKGQRHRCLVDESNFRLSVCTPIHQIEASMRFESALIDDAHVRLATIQTFPSLAPWLHRTLPR